MMENNNTKKVTRIKYNTATIIKTLFLCTLVSIGFNILTIVNKFATNYNYDTLVNNGNHNAIMLTVNNSHLLIDDDNENDNSNSNSNDNVIDYGRLGPRDEKGNLGYKPDITAVRGIEVNTSFIKEKGCRQPVGEGIEGYDGLEVINKVAGGIQESIAEYEALEDTNPLKDIKILCMVYTYEQRHFALESIYNTWARKCDGFIGASNFTDASIGAIDLPHEGPEEYENMWQKVRSMWIYAYDNFIEDYDYFHICGDDTYLIVDNLRAYLRSNQGFRLLDVLYEDSVTKRQQTKWEPQSEDDQRPLLLGFPFDRNANSPRHLEVFPGGGSGYTLNTAALRMFGEIGYDSFHPHNKDSREDAFIGGFFFNHGVYTIDTRDDKGSWRYHSMDAPWLAQFDGMRGVWLPERLKAKFHIESLPGIDGVSTQSVAFHIKYGNTTFDQIKVADSALYATLPINLRMYRYHDLLFRLCKDSV